MLPIKDKINLRLTRPFLFWHLTSVIVLGLMLASLIGGGFLIYVHVFRTIEDVHTIVLLNTNLNLFTINRADYEKIKKILETKQKPVLLPARARNLFIFSAASSTNVQPNR